MEKRIDEIREDMLNKLATKTGINTQEDGSIAVAIVDSVIDEFHALYREMDLMKEQAYLSSSQGMYTDRIAELVGVERESFDSDEELKRQASTSVQKSARGNRLAIEEAAMDVSGVASIDYRPFGSGTGSFIMYVYPQPNYNQLRLLDNVKAALEDVVSDGIYFEVKRPKEVSVNVSMLLQFEDGLSQMERQVLRETSINSVRRYLNNLKRNEVLYVNEIVRIVLNTDQKIKDISIVELRIGEISKQITNTFPANDERFISGDIKTV